MQSTLTERLHEAWQKPLSGLPGRVGLQLRSAGSVIAELDPDQPHYPASTMKLAVLGALLEPGSGVAADELLVGDVFPSAVGGQFRLDPADDQDELTWAHLGRPMAVAQLAERMIVVSSNLATDVLADRLGIDRVQDFVRRAGLEAGVSVRRLIGDTAAEASGVTNTVTAAGLARLLEGLTDGSLLGASGAEQATALLAGQQHLDMIAAGLPARTWSASKGGWVAGVNHDVALVRPESAPDYVLAVCTSTGLSHDDGCALVAELSRLTWEHWTAWHS